MKYIPGLTKLRSGKPFQEPLVERVKREPEFTGQGIDFAIRALGSRLVVEKTSRGATRTLLDGRDRSIQVIMIEAQKAAQGIPSAAKGDG